MPALLTGAETVAAATAWLLASTIAGAYLLDRVGLTFAPVTILPLSLASAIAAFVWLRRHTIWHRPELVAFAAIVVAMFAWLLWMARPDFLPPGSGPDLTHHLLLIDYIERHWRLADEAIAAPYLGEMVHYTPGSQILAALAGAATRTNGLHAVYAVVASTVALKAGIVFLIARRVLPARSPRTTLAVSAVLLLLRPAGYVFGSFTHDSYFAQVVSELFAVAMWWALVVWDERPWTGAMILLAVAGIGVLLTWPIWIGPMLLVLSVVIVLREGLSARERLRHLALAAGPIVAIGALYVAGRLRWIQVAGVDAAVMAPRVGEYGWWFVLLSIGGFIVAATARRGRTTVWLMAAVALQTGVLYVLAKANGARTPYMAFKMFYVAVYPQTVAATMLVAAGWHAATQIASSTMRQGHVRAARLIASALVLIVGVGVAGPVVTKLRPKPVITEPLYRAGTWARAHAPAACVEYLVGDGYAAYWLHLAVLGNPRASARTEDPDTFELRPAIVRWLTAGGLPYAIADTTVLTSDVRHDLDVVAQFGPAVVARRRGESRCPAR